MLLARSLAGSGLQHARRVKPAAAAVAVPQRWLSDAGAVAKREEKDQLEVKTQTAEQKIQRQRVNTVTSPLNRGLFIPDDQLPAIEDGEEGALSGARDNKAFVGRMATIAMPPKHAMSSGTYKYRHWRITFDQVGTWTNHLMGAWIGGAYQHRCCAGGLFVVVYGMQCVLFAAHVLLRCR
jgi:hypothetical protein